MRVHVDEARLFVISDLHLGNPSSTARSRVVPFLDHALEMRANICINGDGFDLAQTSFPRLAGDSVPVLGRLRRLQESGLRVYYVVGNHDMALEHFLSDLVFTELAPFLNVRSGDRRIRVEHGHLYDPWFVRAPRIYDAGTRLIGHALTMIPDIYSTYARLERRVDAWRGERSGQVSDDPYHAAAERLAERGFDAVIFGHTHNAESIDLGGATYLNSGNWMRSSTYVDVDGGAVSLERWDP